MTDAPAVLSGLPEASLQRHVAVLGTSDAGKTYAARGEVEKLLQLGRRVCVVDPTGVYWGIRLQPDRATASPFEIPVFGRVIPGREDGAPVDVPIDGGSGTRLAELVADGEFSAILDVSRMTVGERTRFFADFAERLTQVNRRPLHLVIDEAHQFMPQGRVSDPLSARMLHAGNNLVSGGRALGIRVMLLSQRPAKLHKDSLTQVQTLVAMLNVSPQDRKAVGDWIGDAADPARGREIMAGLPSLPVGEGWIWAPRLDVLSRVKFRPITTCDSSRTPGDGEAAADRPRLASLDLDQLRAALAGPEAAAEPKAAPAREGAGLDQAALDDAHEAGEKRGYANGYSEGFAAGAAKSGELLAQARRDALGEAEAGVDDLLRRIRDLAHAPVQALAPPPPGKPPGPTARPSRRAEPKAARPARMKVLDALAWWEAAGVSPVDRRRACVFVGLSPKASTFGAYVSELAREGLVAVRQSGLVELTGDGRELALTPDKPLKAATLQESARGLLSPAEVRVFDALLAKGGSGVPRDVLADEVGLSRTASTLGVYLSKLTSLGFAEAAGRGRTRIPQFLRRLEPGS